MSEPFFLPGAPLSSKSCFQTRSYKGHFIHSHHDSARGREIVEVQLQGCLSQHYLYKDIPSFAVAERLIRGVVKGRYRRKRVTPILEVV